jgi:glycosyltransferase involved in cell wall biosynthesis
MAQETAVLAADIPALREVTAGAGAARLLPPDDVDAWVDALDNLLHDDDERARLASAGRERAQQYSWSRCADATRAVYREAIEA